MHTYPFHVEIGAPSRERARAHMQRLADDDPLGATVWSEHSAALVFAVEEAAELRALRALLDVADVTQPLDGDDAYDAYAQLVQLIRDRIGELDGEAPRKVADWSRPREPASDAERDDQAVGHLFGRHTPDERRAEREGDRS